MKKTDHKEVWQANLSEELDHWRWWLTTQDEPIRTHRKHRVDPRRKIPACFAGMKRILDVGCGPLPRIGRFNNDGSPLETVAVDPLAKEYNRVLDEVGIDAQVRPAEGHAENLAELFPPGSFDGVHCHNALDHAYDPLEGIRQMLRVVRAGGVVYILCNTNEGEANAYAGLHQWNLCIENGSLIIWREGYRVDVMQALAGSASLADTRLTRNDRGRELLEVVIRKDREIPAGAPAPAS